MEWVEVPGSSYALLITDLDSGNTYEFMAQIKYNDNMLESDILIFYTLPDPDSFGHTDLLWTNTGTGLRYVEYMENLERTGGDGIGTVADKAWQVVGLR